MVGGKSRPPRELSPTGFSCFGLCLCILSLAGCIPVSTVAGRPAAVAPAKWTVGMLGGGFTMANKDFTTLYGEGIQSCCYMTAGMDFGLGACSDLQLKVDGVPVENGIARLSLVLRNQLVGRPASAYPADLERPAPFDLAVEGGGSIANFDDTPADLHVGATLSVPLKGYTPYFTYRHHWGKWLEDDDPDDTFRQHMFFLGIEWPLSKRTLEAIVVEICYGYSTDIAEHAAGPWHQFGLNVVYRIGDPIKTGK